jgi:hypothetical protein
MHALFSLEARVITIATRVARASRLAMHPLLAERIE